MSWQSSRIVSEEEEEESVTSTTRTDADVRVSSTELLLNSTVLPTSVLSNGTLRKLAKEHLPQQTVTLSPSSSKEDVTSDADSEVEPEKETPSQTSSSLIIQKADQVHKITRSMSASDVTGSQNGMRGPKGHSSRTKTVLSSSPPHKQPTRTGSFLNKTKQDVRTSLSALRLTEVPSKPNSTSPENLAEKKKLNRDRKLSIKVFEARNLLDKKAREKVKKKSSSLLKSTSAFLMEVSSPNIMVLEKVQVDAYCKIQVGQHQFKTRTIYRRSNPFWCEEFVVDIDDPDKTVIKITLWDENKYEEHEAVGRIQIPLNVLSEEPHEHWYPLFPMTSKVLLSREDVKGGTKAITLDHPKLGDLRIRLKYTEEIILPFDQYNELTNLIMQENLTIINLLGKVTNDRETVAGILIKVFQSQGKAMELLKTLTREEIKSTPNPSIIFRGNSLATKALDVYMKFIGLPYLHLTLQELIKKLYLSKDSCEIDPTKLEKGEDLKKNYKHLLKWVKRFAEAIFSSLPNCPHEFKEIFHFLQSSVKITYPEDQVKTTKYTAVSGFIFLRFFCPAILGPKLFFLHDAHPSVNTNRTLILIAKTLQNLANLVEFGGGKEDYMSKLNEFLIPNLDRMKTFIDNLATLNANPTSTNVPPYFIEKELASLSRHLKKDYSLMQSKTIDDNKIAMTTLQSILQNIEQLEFAEREKHENITL